ncbi:MAG: aspartyl/glutamyl-tRNA amidotransferase subunit C [uncultured bacterium]|nr:MAG: aspartyl/glutamyl-tRNA amidotransferase subunit C [uncultured bacterium]
MSKLSKDQVDSIARLARIELSDEEKQLYSEQLSGILKFVEKLEEVKTDGIEETSQVTGLENVFREDIADGQTQINADKKVNREGLLSNAPAQKDGYIKVKQILE